MTRILIAHPSADVYGSDLQMLESARAMRDAGWEVRIVVPKPGPLIEKGAVLEFDFLQFPVLRKALLNPRGLAGFTLASIRDGYRLVRYLRRAKPDLVYVNTMTVPIWVVAATLCRIPVLLHVHEAEESASLAIRVALALPAAFARRVAVNSNSAGAALAAALPWIGSKITTVYNGVPDTAQRGAIRQPIPGRLLFAGRLSPRKGVDIALEAVAQLLNGGYNVTLDICGSTFPGYEAYERALRQRASEPDLAGKVNFLGYVELMTEHFGRASILLMPSRAEPFGNVAVEALMALCPVVAARVQGLREVIHDGETGVLVRSDDSLELATAVSRLLDDPQVGVRMAYAGRVDALKRFSVSRYRSAILDQARLAMALGPKQSHRRPHIRRGVGAQE